MIGKKLAHFEVTAKLGEGGMGEVYRAADTKLGREVALKILPASMSSNLEWLERFHREARTIAALNHPNIVTIFSVEEADGRHFLAMELVEGETLKTRAASAPMPLSSLLELVTPIAEGLAAAHEKGIVHRDLKPGNVMVTADARVKVLDFGLAKQSVDTAADDDTALATLAEELTSTGMLIGTPAYMSPEQVRGEPLDGRSDLFSLGLIVYELASGDHPFRRKSPMETASAILSEQAPELVAGDDGVPPLLAHLVSKLLAKDADARYQTARGVLNDLRALAAAGATGGTTSAKAEDDRSIAVLPFANLNRDPDSEFFSDGLTEELINALTRVPDLRIASRSAAFRFKGSSQDARAIGSELGVKTVVEGSVRRAGDRLRVTAQLVEVETGYQVWSQRYDRVMDDVFAVQDELTEAIVQKLEIDLAPVKARSKPRRANSVAAYELYLDGRFHWEQHTGESYGRANELFERAKREDPGFALPYAWQASTLVYQTNFGLADPRKLMPLAKDYALRAVELDEHSAEAHTALAIAAQYWDWDWSETERGYRRSLELAPGDAVTRAWLAIFLTRWRDRHAEAITEADRAVYLDPMGFETNTVASRTYFVAGQPEKAVACGETAVRLYPDRAMGYFLLGICHTYREDFDQAIEAIERGRELDPVYPMGASGLAYCYGRTNQLARAEKMLDAVAVPGSDYRSALWTAYGTVGMGDIDRTLDLLEEAFEQRDGLVTFIQVWRGFEAVWEEPRFLELRRRAGV